MKNLSGVWRITQKWNNGPKYSFKTHFFENGRVSIMGNMFEGTYTFDENSGCVSLGIANFNNRSVSSYVGQVEGFTINGTATGLGRTGRVSSANWSAVGGNCKRCPRNSFGLF